jgi:catechol 2,3-dioxygenase
MEKYQIPAGTSIGHVHLKVAEIDRALTFYRDVLGFDQVMRMGDHAAFISAGGYHHHIGLNTWQSRRGTPAPPQHTGLYHFAIRYDTRRDLGQAVRRVIDAGVPLQGVADHGVSESIYLADPDGNGIELTRDRPESEWPRDDQGRIAMHMADPLDLEALLNESR